MFTTNKFWERVFYLLAYLFEGASFLNPRAYALMHRAPCFSDTEKDPHSPHFFIDVYQMMKAYDHHFRRLCKTHQRPGGSSRGIIPNGR
jgi:stearoyl-CoA desaturase (delta-9 desaturase)